MSQAMRQVVGAIIRDDRNRVYVHRRTASRRLLPGTWDIVGGHVEQGETREQALAREIEEETGWRLRRIEAVAREWDWVIDGVVRQETDYLVEVDGDLSAPRLEAGKQDAHDWVGPGNLELLMAGRADGDRRLRDIVASAVRTRLTARLRLVPMGTANAGDLWRVHYDAAVAPWHSGRYTVSQAQARAARAQQAWERDGTDDWMVYDRTSGELVGRGGVSFKHVDGQHRFEVGWYLRGDMQGKLYATEIGAAGLEYAFTDCGADEVVAFTTPGNQRSRAVMERLGMSYSRQITYLGEPTVLYELSRAQYLAATGRQ
jgi:RimJ/RimL family protein N-acetyltransferase/8-oxo-dGTP pyrophosphatase MutT (NUDIX family)